MNINSCAIASQHPRPEQRLSADDLAGDHEYAVARVVYCLGVFWCRSDVSFNRFKDEKIVLVDQRVTVQSTFKAGMTLTDEWGIYFFRPAGRQREFPELGDFCIRSIANTDDSIYKLFSRQVNDALAAAADHAEAVIAFGDYATHERRHELHNGMPAHRHDICLALPL
jgi:hypothetical protein